MGNKFYNEFEEQMVKAVVRALGIALLIVLGLLYFVQ